MSKYNVKYNVWYNIRICRRASIFELPRGSIWGRETCFLFAMDAANERWVSLLRVSWEIHDADWFQQIAGDAAI